MVDVSAHSETPAPVMVEFGAPRWQAHLGGGFLGPESDGPLAWNWLGESPAWVVLTDLVPATRYRATLEAAPFAPLGGDLHEVALMAAGRTLLKRVVPGSASDPIELAIPSGTIPPATAASVVCAPVGPPILRVALDSTPLCELTYLASSNLQLQDFSVTAPPANAPTPVLHLRPGHAISPTEASLSPDARRLSFRLFRLTLHPLAD